MRNRSDGFQQNNSRNWDGARSMVGTKFIAFICDLFLTCFRPFLVALLVERTQSFFCSGNLITSRHVLTAAHCVQEKGQIIPLEASDVIVLVGRYNLSMRAERGSTTREISQIFLHPDWDPFKARFDADVAILEMEADVKFSLFVQPVCLSRGSGISGILGKREGTVVSYFANNSTSLRQIEGFLGNVPSKNIFGLKKSHFEKILRRKTSRNLNFFDVKSSVKIMTRKNIVEILF